LISIRDRIVSIRSKEPVAIIELNIFTPVFQVLA
jgi:hypothetical protein